VHRYPVVGSLTLLLGLSVCGGGPGPDTPAPEAAPSGGPPAVVQVQNESFAEISVYALLEGARHRLGRARSNAVSNFRLPEQYVGQHRLIQISAMSNATTTVATSRRVEMLPGDTVCLRIPPL